MSLLAPYEPNDLRRYLDDSSQYRPVNPYGDLIRRIQHQQVCHRRAKEAV